MASKHTLGIGATEAQFAAFEQARQRAGLSASAAKEQAFKQFCASQGIEWPQGFTQGGDRKSMKTYNVSLADCRNWRVENIEQPGNGKITMSKTAHGSIEQELPDGNSLTVELSCPNKRGERANIFDTKIEGGTIFTQDGQIVRYVKSEQIQLED